MNKKFIKDGLGWGLLLWFIGYVLGIVLFMLIPPTFIGRVIFPIGFAVTLWVLLKKVKSGSFGYFLEIAILWGLIAYICDYFFLVRLFKPADGYYKLDVYLYYASTFFLPVLVGWFKSTNKKYPKDTS